MLLLIAAAVVKENGGEARLLLSSSSIIIGEVSFLFFNKYQLVEYPAILHSNPLNEVYSTCMKHCQEDNIVYTCVDLLVTMLRSFFFL